MHFVIHSVVNHLLLTLLLFILKFILVHLLLVKNAMIDYTLGKCNSADTSPVQKRLCDNNVVYLPNSATRVHTLNVLKKQFQTHAFHVRVFKIV